MMPVDDPLLIEIVSVYLFISVIFYNEVISNVNYCHNRLLHLNNKCTFLKR